MNIVDKKLAKLKKLVDGGLSSDRLIDAIGVLSSATIYGETLIPGITDLRWEPRRGVKNVLATYRLWGDFMPMGDINPYTEEQRCLHILWECIDKYPIGLNIAFAVPARQIIAKKLFKKCGDGFVCAENCKFNYGHQIEVGDNVSWNAGCYIDSKGGVSFGDFAMLTEQVKIFSHSHSEEDHMVREYNPVRIEEYAKIYTNATILPGVTVGRGALVATGAVVTKDVPEFTLVAGVPAKPIRQRKCTDVTKYNQYMMKDGLFQKTQPDDGSDDEQE